MRLYYDTEFVDNGRTIDLISVGMVAEDGRELYLVNRDEEIITRAVHHPWLRANVISSLPVTLTPGAYGWDWNDEHADALSVVPHEAIADLVREFLQATSDLELWAWYGAYDFIALCQLYGPMINLPSGIPMWTNDLRQECHRLGVDPGQMPEQPAGEHNALADARHNRVRGEWLAQCAARMVGPGGPEVCGA